MISPPRKQIAAHVILALVALLMMLPFIWMFLASFKTVREVEGSQVLPTTWHVENYTKVFKDPEIAQRSSFGRYYFNSFFVAAWVTFLTCITSAMAAYAFSRLRWRGRDTIFLLYLGTLMVPGVVTMIPNFALMVKLKLLDSYAGLIVPASFNA